LSELFIIEFFANSAGHGSGVPPPRRCSPSHDPSPDMSIKEARTTLSLTVPMYRL
jgi:hypothetical protein